MRLNKELSRVDVCDVSAIVDNTAAVEHRVTTSAAAVVTI